ncbi:FGGY-family carbohydrate kinase [Pararhizobium sp.]|uniref:FGGY-family carbohydrate kinase n=1 Tax=Pararhizobium sp. TaxID=1977563 RepID=UPI0027217E8E|nr:FGGY-family carbohydrate kinase [Pararhizobium sp.]MDO9414627.1 FGGY-family carbohydrate kinase [Pararhizobium sp.]
MRDILIGIDAGTSVIKSVAFDLGGRQIAVSAIPNSYDNVGQRGVAQDLARTWADTARTLADLAGKVENLASRVVAISVTAQGDGSWMIDRNGDPVGKGWLWLDARASDTVAELRTESGDADRFSHTASGLAACQQGSQLRWMQDHAPEYYAGATTAFHCKDWLYFNLTGIRATDPSEAVFTFGDFRTRTYSDSVIGFLGIEKLKYLLPEIVDGADTHHPLSAEAARLTGLLQGTPVVLGYVDVACTSLGAGLYEPGTDTGCSIVGSTGMHMRLANSADDVQLNSHRTGYTMCMPVPGIYAQMQSNMSATLNIDWILSVAGNLFKSVGIEKTKSELLAQVDGWLAEGKAASVIYHPYISDAGERGPFVDASARASFVGLTMGHGFGDMVRAVFDGLALAARDCYAEMGPLPKNIRLTGGAARSAPLRRIIGGALGASVQTSEREEAGAAGTAMIAAVSLGIYGSMADCVKDWVTPFQRAPEPADAALSKVYEEAFPAYRQSRLALQPVWPALAARQAAAIDQ